MMDKWQVTPMRLPKDDHFLPKMRQKCESGTRNNPEMIDIVQMYCLQIFLDNYSSRMVNGCTFQSNWISFND